MKLTKKAQNAGKIRKHITNAGKERWVVDLGRIEGRRQRKYFKDRKSAERHLEQKASEKERHGSSALQLPDSLRQEATECQKRLQKVGASIATATEFYLAYGDNGSFQKTLDDAITEFLNFKQIHQNRDETYVGKLRIALDVFSRDFSNRAIQTILPTECERWLDSKNWKPLNRRNYIRDLGIFFNWAEKKEIIQKNPFRLISKPTVKLETPKIFTVAEAKSLLSHAYADKSEGLLPFVCLGLFAGIRVCELGRMDWKDVVLEEGHINIRPEVAKNKAIPRTIDISDNLEKWLLLCVQEIGSLVPKNFRNKRDRLYRKVGIKAPESQEGVEPPIGGENEFEERRNPFRHSFGSNHLVKHDDPGKTQLQMGQQTPSVLFKHYRQVVTRKQAAAYWTVFPEAIGLTN